VGPQWARLLNGPIYSRRMKARAKIVVAMPLALVCALALSACGSQGDSVPKSSPYYRGSVIFRDHCSGCHTLAVVGAEGSATSIKDRLKTNGPNFNYRKEDYEQVMYAIHNGGFSGAIMPENIVLGTEAHEVAKFLAQYSGLKAEKVPTTSITLSTK
jgi:mono/diheme cytochrome c family protein